MFLTTAIATASADGQERRRPGPPPEGRRAGKDRRLKADRAAVDLRLGDRPPGGGLRGGGPPSWPQVEHEFVLLCIDRATGRILWQRTAVKAVPHQGHRPCDGTFANESPVTDGKYVFAFFGSRGVFCYDLNGNLVWKKNLGRQPGYLPRVRRGNKSGPGRRPALYQGRS